MPKFSTLVPTPEKPAYTETETIWLKPADLARDETHFCIERITKGDKVDDYGNLHWYLSIILENHPENIRYMLKFTVNGGKRDALLAGLQQRLIEAHAANDDDQIIHGCMIVGLKPQKKGHQPYMHLTEHESPICACGYDETGSIADKEAQAAYSETVPF